MTRRANLTDTVLPSTTAVPLRFADYRGERVVLLLGNQKTGTAVQELARSLQSTPATANTPILQVAHLAGVPRLLHRLAERDIRNGVRAQEELAGELLRARGRTDPEGRLLSVGLDWHGEVTTQLGFSSRDTRPLATVVDERGDVLDPPPEEDPVAGLARLLAEPARPVA